MFKNHLFLSISILFSHLLILNNACSKIPTDSLIKQRPDSITIENVILPVLCTNSFENRTSEALIINSVNLQRIEGNAFRNSQFLHVKIINNSLKTLEGKIFAKSTWRTLDLSNNALERIDPSAFDDMPELKSLDLSRNEIGEINPKWFKNCGNLIELRLKSNFIKTIPALAFRNVKDDPLTLITLSYNEISDVSAGAFENFENGVFWLDHNRIERFSHEAFGSDKRKCELWMGVNRVRDVTKSLLDSLTNACKHIDLSDNPLNEDSIRILNDFNEVNRTEVDLYFN